MPSSPASICRECTKRTVNNTSYCADHSESQHTKEYDAARSHLEHRKLYASAKWRHIRAIILRRDVLCKLCGHRAAQVVHHVIDAIVYLAQGHDFFDLANLIGWCKPCHDTHTARTTGWAKQKT